MRINNMKLRYLTIAAFLITLFGCSNKPSSLAECRMEALKSFGHLRVKNEFGYYAFQNEFEDRYIELCMKSKGFKLKGDSDVNAITADIKLHTVGTQERDIYEADESNWIRDYSIYAP